MSKNQPSSNPTYFKIHSRSCKQSFVMVEISAQDVNNSIDNIKPHSAPGVDGISPKFIKLAKPILPPYIASLFNKCIQQENFPHDFKLAHVIPIPKTFSKSLDKFQCQRRGLAVPSAGDRFYVTGSICGWNRSHLTYVMGGC